MKLDASVLRYQTKEEFRILVSIEMGMKNHEIVPTVLIGSISGLKANIVNKSLKSLHKNKLIHHEAKNYDGFKLTYLGYDFLALKAMSHRESICSVGKQIGVGKESDIFLVANAAGEELCLKLHRLGRTSFRAIKNKRDYLKHRKSASWLYMSRLAAVKEFAFMKALYDHDFPVPVPIDQSRHCVVMSLCKGYPLCHVANVRHPGLVYSELMNLIVRFAQHGLIHCDFNEFNIMIDDEEKITVIDFPQMVSTTHVNADFYFNRDVQCIRTYFERRYNFISDYYPKFEDYVQRVFDLDIEVEASGFSKKMESTLEEYIDRDTNEANEEQIEIEIENNTENKDNKGDNEEECEENDDNNTEDEKEKSINKKNKLAEMRKKILLQQRNANSPNNLVSITESEEIKDDFEFINEEQIDDSDLNDDKEVTDQEITEKEVTNTKVKSKKGKKKNTKVPNDYVRSRVKQNLARRNKPKLKANSNKNRSKRANKLEINEGVW